LREKLGKAEVILEIVPRNVLREKLARWDKFALIEMLSAEKYHAAQTILGKQSARLKVDLPHSAATFLTILARCLPRAY
jgi:hypothetical protein